MADEEVNVVFPLVPGSPAAALRRLYGKDDISGLLAEMNRIRSMSIGEAVGWMCERSGVERIVVDSNPELAERC